MIITLQTKLCQIQNVYIYIYIDWIIGAQFQKKQYKNLLNLGSKDNYIISYKKNLNIDFYVFRKIRLIKHITSVLKIQ